MNKVNSLIKALTDAEEKLPEVGSWVDLGDKRYKVMYSKPVRVVLKPAGANNQENVIFPDDFKGKTMKDFWKVFKLAVKD